MKLSKLKVFQYNTRTVSGKIYQSTQMGELPERCAVYLTNEEDPLGSKLLIGWAENFSTVPLVGVYCDVDLLDAHTGIAKLHMIDKVVFTIPVVDGNEFVPEVYCLENA